MVDFHTAQILFMAKHNLLPENIQTLFTGREGGYNLRGKFKFKILKARTTRKFQFVGLNYGTVWGGHSGNVQT